MKNHVKCRPPRGAFGVSYLNARGKWQRVRGSQPASVFVGLMPDPRTKLLDTTSAIIWIASCDCKISYDCPRQAAFDYAAENYDTASVHIRPRVSAKRALGLDKKRRRK